MQGDVDGAISFLESSDSSILDRTSFNLDLASLYLSKGSYSTALDIYRNLLKDGLTEDHRVHNGLQASLLEMSDFDNQTKGNDTIVSTTVITGDRMLSTPLPMARPEPGDA